MGLVSRLPLTSHSDSGSFPVVRASLSQDGFQREGFWEVGRIYHLLPPLLAPQVALVVKNPPANAGGISNLDSVPGGGHGNSL